MPAYKRKNRSGKVVWFYKFSPPGAIRGSAPIRKFGFATKRDAEDAEAERRIEVQLKYEAARKGLGIAAPVPKTLAMLMEEFLVEHAQKKLALKTVERYREQASSLDPELLNMPLKEITPLHLSREWNRLLESGGHTRRDKTPRPLSAKSVRNIAGVVSSAFLRAIKWGLVATNPVTNSEPPIPKKHEGMAFLPTEQNLLINSASGPWCLPMLLEMAAASAARRGEIMALRWSDINDGEVVITRSLSQTRQGLEFKGTKTEKLLSSEYAVKVYGQGHVVAYNYIAHWHDGVDIATYGTPDGTPNEIPDRVPLAIDFYNNDVFNMGDNCFETDGGARNIRVFRNRCFNSASGALSVQPVFGGPVYFYQNLIYNTPTGSLKYIEESAGVLTYNNTIIGEGRAGPASNETFRNNLILAQGAFDPVFAITTFTNYTSSDYNGFRPNPGVEDSFEWNSPPFGMAADFSKAPVVRRFKTLKEYSEATGQERHSVLVDYDTFAKVTKPDMTDPQRVYDPAGFDFQLRSGSAAVDAGVVLPNINDDFTGRGPDLGAYETGRPIPHYGPR